MARSQEGALDGLLEAACGSGRGYPCSSAILVEASVAPLALVAVAVGGGESPVAVQPRHLTIPSSSRAPPPALRELSWCLPLSGDLAHGAHRFLAHHLPLWQASISKERPIGARRAGPPQPVRRPPACSPAPPGAVAPPVLRRPAAGPLSETILFRLGLGLDLRSPRGRSPAAKPESPAGSSGRIPHPRVPGRNPHWRVPPGSAAAGPNRDSPPPACRMPSPWPPARPRARWIGPPSAATEYGMKPRPSRMQGSAPAASSASATSTLPRLPPRRIAVWSGASPVGILAVGICARLDQHRGGGAVVGCVVNESLEYRQPVSVGRPGIGAAIEQHPDHAGPTEIRAYRGMKRRPSCRVGGVGIGTCVEQHADGGDGLIHHHGGLRRGGRNMKRCVAVFVPPVRITARFQ